MTIPPKTPIGTAWIDEEGSSGIASMSACASTGRWRRRTTRVLSTLVGDRVVPALVDVAGVQFADRDARDVFARLRSTVEQPRRP